MKKILCCLKIKLRKKATKEESSSPLLNRKKITRQGNFYLGAKIKRVDVGGQTGYFTSKEKLYERDDLHSDLTECKTGNFVSPQSGPKN